METPASQEVQDVQRPLVTQYPRQQHQSQWQQQGSNDQRGTAAIIKVPGDTPDEGSVKYSVNCQIQPEAVQVKETKNVYYIANYWKTKEGL